MRPEPPAPTAEELAALQAIIDKSTRTATASVAESIAYPPRQMTAAEVVEFWRGVRLVAMTTVGPKGQPHTAPVHAEICGPVLRVVIYDDTVRRVDIRTNPRVSFTTWSPDGGAAIVYGRAREIPDSLHDARAAKSGNPRRVVSIEVKLTRVYAMRAPQSAGRD